MKIIVTGATGFIGSHLIRTLTQMGHDCMGMDDCSTMGYPGWMDRFMEENHNVQFVIGDEGDCTKEWNIFNVFKKFKPELVFNLAVKCLPHSLEFPLTNFMDNVTITRNVVQGASHADAKLVHFSSSEVYGQAVMM